MLKMIEKRRKKMEEQRNKLAMYNTIWRMSGLSEETMRKSLIRYTGKDIMDAVKSI